MTYALVATMCALAASLAVTAGLIITTTWARNDAHDALAANARLIQQIASLEHSVQHWREKAKRWR